MAPCMGHMSSSKVLRCKILPKKKKNASALKEPITDHQYILIAFKGTRSMSFKLLLCLVPDLNIAS